MQLQAAITGSKRKSLNMGGWETHSNIFEKKKGQRKRNEKKRGMSINYATCQEQILSRNLSAQINRSIALQMVEATRHDNDVTRETCSPARYAFVPESGIYRKGNKSTVFLQSPKLQQG